MGKVHISLVLGVQENNDDINSQALEVTAALAPAYYPGL